MTSITNNTRDKELALQQTQLYWLLQITKAINYNLPASQLYEIYQKVVFEHLNFGRLSLIVKGDIWNEQVAFGLTVPTQSDELVHLIERINLFDDASSKLPDWMRQFETFIPVLHNEVPIAYAFVGGISDSVFDNKREATSYLHTITNVISVAIENKRMAKESLVQAAVQRELQLAAEMQAMLFPQDLNLHGFMDVSATYIPHHQVGGDYYDFIQLNQDEAIICMADVSGKGVSAALLMSNFQANLHALVKNNQSLKEIVLELNSCVNKSAKGEKFITFFIGKVNKTTREIEYINAGHHPPMLISDKDVVILDSGTTGLGMFDELPFLKTGKVHFSAGSILFLYTDGITEMENTDGVALGESKLKTMLQDQLAVDSMEQLHKNLQVEFELFRENVEYNDDVTFLSCRLLY